LSEGAAALDVEAGLAGGVGAGVVEGATALDAAAGFDDAAAGESERAAERVDRDVRAATPNAMAEYRLTL
jgi:hypothetical protein